MKQATPGHETVHQSIVQLLIIFILLQSICYKILNTLYYAKIFTLYSPNIYLQCNAMNYLNNTEEVPVPCVII